MGLGVAGLLGDNTKLLESEHRSLNSDDQFISEDSFMDDYKPITHSQDGDMVIQSIQEAQDRLKALGLTDDHIWTITESEESLFASPGFHVVNRIGYVITERPAKSDVVDAIWHDATDDERGNFDVTLDYEDDDHGMHP